MDENKKVGNEELISVIVPVYNAEKYLSRCLDSILAQTYKKIEVLLIDDGSTDESGKICDKYQQIDKRIRVIHKDNSGVADTRNVGITKADGKYISFVDSDDYIDSNMLKDMFKRANEDNSDIVMCEYSIDKNGIIEPVEMKYKTSYVGYQQVKDGLIYLYYTDYHTGLYSLCNKLIKKSIYFDNNVYFDSSLKRGEDAWFIFQCLKYCKRVDFIKKAYYFYFQNDASIMHLLYEDQYEKWVYMRKLLLEENKILKLDINYSLFYKEFLYKVAVYCRELANKGQSKKIKEIIEDEFYLKTIKYNVNLPIHIKILIKMARLKISKVTITLYKLWAKI